MAIVLDALSWAMLVGGALFVLIGGIGALEPARRADLADLGLRAMLGGLLACYLTACLAGLLV